MIHIDIDINMRYTKFTSQYSRLANGSHKVEVNAQWECYFLKYVVHLSAKASQDPIPIRVVQQFTKLRIEKAMQNGITFDFLPDLNGPPYYSIIQVKQIAVYFMALTWPHLHMGLHLHNNLNSLGLPWY